MDKQLSDDMDQILAEFGPVIDAATVEKLRRLEETGVDNSWLQEMCEAIWRDIPDEEWDKLPRDLSVNLDHYLYGSPKVDVP